MTTSQLVDSVDIQYNSIVNGHPKKWMPERLELISRNEKDQFVEYVSIEQAMQYLVKLVLENHE